MKGAEDITAAVLARLEEAGRTLLAMGNSGTMPAGYGRGWPDVIHDAAEAYGYEMASGRPRKPRGSEIDRMDKAFTWLTIIPADRFVLRRVVAARCLVSPMTGRHVYPWRRLGRVLGADHRAVQRWHRDGIALIVDRFARLDRLGIAAEIAQNMD